jgi:hypothetical protein
MSSYIERQINIDINNEEANSKLKKTEQQLNKVATSTKTVSKENVVLKQNTETLTESVQKNGGAMALLDTITGGLASQFRDGYEAAGLMTGGLKGLRGAIVATGIGAFAVVLGLVATNFDAIRAFFTGGGFSDLDKQTSNLNQSIVEYSQTLKDLEASEKIAINEAKKRGASEIELRELENDFLIKKNKLKSEGSETSKSELAIAQEQLEADQKSFENSKEYQKIRNNDYRLNNNQSLDLQKRIEDLQSKLTSGKIKESANVKQRLADLKIQYEIVKKEEDEKINSIKNLTTEGQKLVASEQKVKDIQRDIKVEKTQIKLNQAEINRLKAEEDRLDTERFNNIVRLRKEFDLILNDYNEQTTQLKVDSLTTKGGFFSDSVKNDIASIQRLSSTLTELEKKRKEIEEVGTGEGQKGLTEEQKLQLSFINEQITQNEALLQVKNEELELSSEVRGAFKDLSNLDKMALIDLQNEYDKLTNKIFEFEKGFEKNGKYLDERNDNSNKFIEIQSNVNDIYQKQIEIIENTKEQTALQFEERKKLIEKDIQKIKDSLIFDKLTVAQKVQLNAQLLDLNKELNDVEQEQSIANYNFKKELELVQYDFEIETERNKIAKKQAMRAEDLERQSQYYNAVQNIIAESAGLASALEAQGDKNSRKWAERALFLQKAAGLASIAISTQEEIRGIWANPSLTALPDTGVTAKTALTVAAGTRAGLSAATILAQKLNGGASSNTSSGASAPANFNIVESSGNNQLASQIAQQQNQPIQTFVVGSAVTSQQALDRNILQNSTFL